MQSKSLFTFPQETLSLYLHLHLLHPDYLTLLKLKLADIKRKPVDI